LAQKLLHRYLPTVHGYNDRNRSRIEEQGKEGREHSAPSQYSERESLQIFKTRLSQVYCYTDNSNNRQIITICTECFRRYQEKRYEIVGKPLGVIAISGKSKVERLIMCALRLALINNTRTKRNGNSILEIGSIFSLIISIRGDSLS
jgi:hypothetical protein